MHYSILISGQKVRFDFRFVGDDYYDTRFQKKILDNRVLSNKIFYKPSDLDYFYSLIYHAVIHKRSISEDYLHKILKTAEQINLRFAISDKLSICKILEEYLLKSNYLITKPEDHSVYFSKDNIDIYSLIQYLKKEFKLDDIEFFLEDKWQKNIFSMMYFVGYKEKKKLFIKVGKSESKLIEREVEVIRYLSQTDIAIPELVNYCKFKNFSILVENFIEGELLTDILEQNKLSKENVSNIICSLKKIIKVLHKRRLIHRDLRPDNLILSNGKIFLIDFAFVLDQKHNKFPELDFVLENIDNIKDLGGEYKLSKLIWDDVSSCQKIIKEIYPKYNKEFFKEYMFFIRKAGKIRVSYRPIRYRVIKKLIKLLFFTANRMNINKGIILCYIKKYKIY